jgi:hypothetical protein
LVSRLVVRGVVRGGGLRVRDRVSGADDGGNPVVVYEDLLVIDEGSNLNTVEFFKELNPLE